MLNAAGAKLKPRVYCLHHPSGGAGIPDFGLFEQAQFRRGDAPEWTAAVVPERGVVEVKGAAHSIDALIRSDQVARRYLPAYGLVLATNLWQFRLVQADGSVFESFDLAANEAGFWALLRSTRPDTLRVRFGDFLQRCLLTRAPLSKPADLAFFLASYARDALARLTERADLPGLRTLRNGMQQALGITFDGRDGEHLFRSTLVQTLFYGLFSAWVTHVRGAGRGRFDWRSAQWSLTVPVARFLFQQVATPEALEPLELVPLMDAAGAALERVDQAAFFRAFEDAHAVRYFYEPFLEFFDPELRRELGVWYTPPEIVTYMVERVDRLLQTELGVADGLADPNVWVLDPCCGTGSYIVAVLDRIRRTLESRGLGDLVGERLREAATRRIVGFEIMTAPFVIAHWQVGEALRHADAPLSGGERASIFLTNALIGWETDEERAEMPGFEVLTRERTAASAVKRDEPILVMIGNPPYNAYAGISPVSEGGLVEPYKTGLQERWGVKKFNLDDLFVRFFRIAERRIAERTGRGIVCYIANYSWLSLPSFTIMRQSLLQNFDRIWIENMHGDRTITEYGPDGRSSETVFAVDGFSPGIRQGVATALLVRTGNGVATTCRFRNDFDASKASQRRQDLLASLESADFDQHYQLLVPTAENRYLLRPISIGASYSNWPAVSDLAKVAPLPGLLEKRGGSLISMERESLEERMRGYLDPTRSFEVAAHAVPGLAADWARYSPKGTRARVLREEGFKEANLLRYCFFAFDLRWAYVSGIRPLWNEPRPQLLHILPDAGGFLAIRPQRIAEPEGFPAYWTNCLGDDHALHKDAFFVPIMENLSGAPRPNLSDMAAAFLRTLGLTADRDVARLLWHHVLAITYTPAYLAENAGGLGQGYPRVPLPSDRDLFTASAALGARLAALLDPDTAVPGVTSGDPHPELRAIGVPMTRPDATRNWRLTVNWGHRTDKGITMPGRGRTEPRPYAGTEAPTASRSSLLGQATQDIFLNDATCWRNVPDSVWECRIGGYQVLKKWLSYRETIPSSDGRSQRRRSAIFRLPVDGSPRSCCSDRNLTRLTKRAPSRISA